MVPAPAAAPHAGADGERCDPYWELIDEALGIGRNAKATFEELSSTTASPLHRGLLELVALRRNRPAIAVLTA